ncbi:MAG: hypothetical protein ACJ8AT_36480 [Hyalangium sp.]|uniref:hypothetical protein n=1 Tax=Hyalangium sp. TaxID=2028555 RepID=UPI003899FD05
MERWNKTAMQPPHPADVEIRHLDATSLERTIDCVSALYPRHNVIARALGFTAEEYRPIAERACRVALEADMGLLAVHPATHEVLGFLFCHDLVDQFSAVAAMARNEDERLRAWSEMHSRLLALYERRYGQPQARGQVLYMNITALAPEIRGQGLTPRLTYQALVEFGIQRGYRAHAGIATHSQTRRLLAQAAPTVEWSESLSFAELSDPRLRSLDGAAQIFARPIPETDMLGIDALFPRSPPS